jgi:Superfamily II DNA/RNA helicases, SNF2 family
MQFVPHEYQKYCIDRMISADKLGLYLDMGLGKTVITLTAIADLKYNRFQVVKTLVIAPKKVAEATWSKEIEKWEHLKHLRIVPILGNLNKRIKSLYTKGDIYVINRENTQWLVDYLKNDWDFDMVVIDEFSSFKNSKAKRFKALTLVRDKISRFVGLTGTPTPNGLMDLWAQIYLLDKGDRLEKKIGQYRERYFDPGQRNGHVVFNYTPKAGAAKAIQNKISDICISMKSDDYLELPDIIYNDIPVILDSKAQKKYNELEEEMVLEIKDKIIDVASAAALSNKLLQLANGAVYDEDRGVHEVHNCKIEAFLELIEQLNGKSVLVFYNFKHDLERLLKALSKTGYRIGTLKTVEDQNGWNKREFDILLAHPASSAYGLNLQEGGNHVIWFGLNWSLELYQQANKRLHRQGQKEKVIIHHLIVEDSRDSDVIRALNIKGGAQESLLESLKVRLNKYKGVDKK